MLKLFVYDRLPNQADSKLLKLFLTENEYEGNIFQKIASAPFKKMVEIVSTVEESHYILMPNDYSYLGQQENYLNELDSFAELHKKKIIVLNYGDLVDKVQLKSVIVLRTASYKRTLSSNEIIIPPFIEDIGSDYGTTSRHKDGTPPVVGFAGMVALPTRVKEIKYQIKKLIFRFKVLLGTKRREEAQGLYFRRSITKALDKTDKCKTNFVIRNSFSALEKTLSKAPDVLRKEYIDVLQNSDLGLVIRGDGNFSLRFFEVLSMGRIPLFINTDTPLPLEDEIDYDSFMLRVDHSDLRRLPAIIEKFWNDLSDEQFIEMQKKARTVFETKLRTDVFYKNLFDTLERKVKVEITQ
ncbi:MAG: hypothetical protein ACI9BF_000191 [Candidatus Paceibacteria bacterium]|jgi:hypothetical protein